ncbi:hypothetical protein J1N35_018702 [Gossypium stocksii]|uniref:Uncharacterized protein n=1 Tax=Gossypium stocksii TaxID=47602 RepID=A0A9D3VRI6_9ROSI|nr:hypothetical protein J1N35_018702 [Gossypium stocksii]
MIRQIQEKVGISIKREDDLESFFSIEDEPTEKTICAIPTYFSKDESDYSDSSVYGPYYQQILQVLQEYKAEIPDPSEWSQEYPMHCSQIEMERVRLLNSTLQDDKDGNSESGNDKDDSYGFDPDYNSDWSFDSAQLPHSNANS